MKNKFEKRYYKYVSKTTILVYNIYVIHIISRTYVITSINVEKAWVQVDRIISFVIMRLLILIYSSSL